MKPYYYTLEEFDRQVYLLAEMIKESGTAYTHVFGVPQGGIPVAMALSLHLRLPLTQELYVHSGDNKHPNRSILVVDDLVDSGATRLRYENWDFACLHIKTVTPAGLTMPTYFVETKEGWIDYWWEGEQEESKNITENVTRLLQYIGENPSREGLLETPDRVVRSYKELFGGYHKKVEDILKTFDSDGYDEIVLLKNIEIYSMCEHHMLPFVGKAHVAYIPNKRVIGISKLARLVEIYARRLQIQERLGNQVTESLMEHLKPKAAACIIEAEHFCMRMRGVNKQQSVMTTSSLKGVFMEESTKGLAARNELMRLIY